MKRINSSSPGQLNGFTIAEFREDSRAKLRSWQIVRFVWICRTYMRRMRFRESGKLYLMQTKSELIASRLDANVNLNARLQKHRLSGKYMRIFVMVREEFLPGRNFRLMVVELELSPMRMPE